MGGNIVGSGGWYRNYCKLIASLLILTSSVFLQYSFLFEIKKKHSQLFFLFFFPIYSSRGSPKGVYDKNWKQQKTLLIPMNAVNRFYCSEPEMEFPSCYERHNRGIWCFLFNKKKLVYPAFSRMTKCWYERMTIDTHVSVRTYDDQYHHSV